VIRPVTRADIREYAGQDIPEWCVAFGGYAAEQAGAVVALGLVILDSHGRIWGGFESKVPLSPVRMHRSARKVLARLRDAGESVMHAHCSQSIPGAEKWLRRLGFVPAPEMTIDPNHPVWTCTLST
jgi:hypothetical protein